MNIKTIFKGVAMGIAEIIPGVSGGTIAFITGIYERLLDAIKAFNLHNIKHLFSGRVKTFWEAVDGAFLVSLFTGIAIGMVVGVFSITYLMDYYIEPLWGFFFGLILASVVIISKQIYIRDWKRILLLLAGIAFALFVITINPVEGTRAYWYVFVSGTIAISALMMPGISGSFMLLIMGMYGIIIPEFKALLTTFSTGSIVLLAIFALGLLTGLLSFSRVLSWTFKKYHQSTLMVLTGFMIGSLYKIWPWRVPNSWVNKITNTIENDLGLLQHLEKHDYKVISEKLVLPGAYFLDDPKTILVIIAVIFGFLSVWLMDRYFGVKTDATIEETG